MLQVGTGEKREPWSLLSRELGTNGERRTTWHPLSQNWRGS